jgi:hypothetical protein
MAFLNISVKNKNGILRKIDAECYLGLDDCTRLELYSFMVALGFASGYPSDFDGAKDSLVREEYTKNNNICYAFSALYFNEHKDKVEEIADTDKVFALADKYANTGFSVMSDYINEYSQNALAMKLLSEMDEMYEEYKDSL